MSEIKYDSEFKYAIEDISDYSKYYCINTHCSNCGKHDAIYVLKGDKKPGTVRCQNCECYTATTGSGI